MASDTQSGRKRGYVDVGRMCTRVEIGVVRMRGPRRLSLSEVQKDVQTMNKLPHNQMAEFLQLLKNESMLSRDDVMLQLTDPTASAKRAKRTVARREKRTALQLLRSESMLSRD